MENKYETYGTLMRDLKFFKLIYQELPIGKVKDQLYIRIKEISEKLKMIDSTITRTKH